MDTHCRDINGEGASSGGAFIILTALRSGLYCVIVPFWDPTAICLPFGLQQNEETSAAGGISFISIDTPTINIGCKYTGNPWSLALFYLKPTSEKEGII